MANLWQAAQTLISQAVQYAPGFLFNVAFFGVTGIALWLAFGYAAGRVRDRLSIVVIGGVMALLLPGFLGLGLGMVGWFSRPAFFGAWAALLAAALWLAHYRGRWRASIAAWSGAAPLPRWLPWLILAWLILYSRPFELVVGGRDPGVYVNTAAQIVERGSLAVSDPFFAALSAADRAQLVWRLDWFPQSFPHKMPGFFWIESAGQLLPQFVHFYPGLMAGSYAAAGYGGALTVLPVVSLLFALLLADLAAHLGRATTKSASLRVGSKREMHSMENGGLIAKLAAPLAGFGLLLSPASYWFGRYANADVLYGMFVFAGLLFWVRAGQRQDPGDELRAAFFRTLAILVFGAALLTKIDSWYIAPAAAAIAVLACRPDSGYRGRVWPRIAWLFVTLCYLADIAFFSYPYVLLVLISEGVPATESRALAVAIAAAYVLGLTICALLPPFLAPDRLSAWRERLRLPDWSITAAIAAICAGLALFFAWFVPANTTLARQLAVIESYVPWPVLLLALGGIVLAILQAERDPAALILLALFFSSGLFILARTDIVDYPWSVRRAVSVAIPALVLFAAVGASWLLARVEQPARLMPRQATVGLMADGVPAGVATLIVIALLFVPMLARDRVIFAHMEVAGARAELRTLEEIFPANAVILTSAAHIMDLFAPALTLAGRDIVSSYKPLAETNVTPELLDRVADQAAREGRPFFFVTPADVAPQSQHYPLTLYRADEWSEVRMAGPHDPWPMTSQANPAPYRVFQLLGATGR